MQATPIPDGSRPLPARQGAFWLIFGLSATRALGAVFTVLLQRALGPAVVGIFELAATPYELLDNVRNFGTGPALIFESRVDRRTADTAWTINLILAILAGVAAEIVASPVARFYNHPQIEGLLRILAVVYIFHAAGSVHSFLLLRDLDFRARCIAPIGQVVLSGTIGLILTAWGMGVGSLLTREIVSGVAGALLLWAVHPYRPRLHLERALVMQLTRYSAWVGLGLTTLFLSQNADIFIGGHFIRSASDIGFYKTAWNLAFLVAGVGTLAAGGLVFPTLSRLTHDMDALRERLLRAIRQLALGVLPVAAGVAVTAPTLIVPLLGIKWVHYRESFLVLSILAGYAGTRTLLLSYFEAYKAIGKPWIMVAYNAAKLAILLPGMIVGAQFGIMGLALVYLPVQVVELPVAVAIAKVVLGITPRETWEALRVPLAATVAMATIVAATEKLLLALGCDDVVTAFASILVAPCIYFASLFLISREVLEEARGLLLHGL